MNKGYVIPIVLIILLIVLAGFFVFTPASSPTIVDIIPPKATTSIPLIEENPEESIENTSTTTPLDPQEQTDQEQSSTSTDTL